MCIPMTTAVSDRFRWSGARRLAASLLAIDELTDEQIAAEVGVSGRALWYWKAHPVFKAEVGRLTHEAAGKVLARGIAKKANRIARLDERWNLMQQVRIERAADPAVQDVPGGKTGLIVRQVKQIGAGRDAQLVEEYAVDVASLREEREMEKQAAQDVGDWEKRAEAAQAGMERLTIREVIVERPILPEGERDHGHSLNGHHTTLDLGPVDG